MVFVQNIAIAFLLWTKRLNRNHKHLELGVLGEKLAKLEAKKRGWKILRKNFRAPGGGEIDLVCRHHNTLIFAEVKTRSSDTMVRPMDAVNRKKQQLIVKAATYWLSLLNNCEIKIRFDIIEVILTHNSDYRTIFIENAFPGMPE